MSAGTLTLTNNATYVVGQGTSFTTEIAAGDFILVTVGGLPYTLPVKSVEKQYVVDAGQQFYWTDTGWRSPVCYPSRGVEYGHSCAGGSEH